MNYIIDIDALKSCLELTPQCKVNGEPYVSLEIITEMIDRFPKEELSNFVERFEYFHNIKT